MRPKDTQMCVKRDLDKEKEELPVEIWLIPESDWEHGGFWSWCDDPCPTPMHSDDYAVRYIKSPKTPAKGLPMPRAIEHYQANALRDQELILEQKDEIAKLKQKINKLDQRK